jgi:2-polyprenyl-3-methyl-5-hydroxy-6-metoxy-1,4-benzoquinol methylase
MRCPICQSDDTEPLLAVDRFPYFNLPVRLPDKEKILEKYEISSLVAPLHYNFCSECGHVPIKHFPDHEILDDLYSNYYSYPSALLGQFKATRDDRFIRIFLSDVLSEAGNLSDAKLLEIGCFDGYVLSRLQKTGLSLHGCDPSEGADIGRLAGLDITKKPFSANHYLERDMIFDIVLSRHFIEHVECPADFVGEMGQILKEGGLLVVETPNITHFLEQGLLEAFSLQHVNLFSESSISRLLSRQGFSVEQVFSNSENLVVVARKSCSPDREDIEPVGNDWEIIVSNFRNAVSLRRQQIQDYTKDKTRLVIWGAGGFGLAMIVLYRLPISKIAYFVDSDMKKEGMEYLYFRNPICQPGQLLKKRGDLVILASMYADGIYSEAKILKDQDCLMISPEVRLLSHA